MLYKSVPLILKTLLSSWGRMATISREATLARSFWFPYFFSPFRADTFFKGAQCTEKQTVKMVTISTQSIHFPCLFYIFFLQKLVFILLFFFSLSVLFCKNKHAPTFSIGKIVLPLILTFLQLSNDNNQDYTMLSTEVDKLYRSNQSKCIKISMWSALSYL